SWWPRPWSVLRAPMCRSGFVSDCLGLAQGGNFAGAEAELPEHGRSMLAESGRRGGEAAGRARQRHRLARQPHDGLVLTLERLRHAEMDHLRIGVDLIDGIDRSAGNAGLVEQIDPFGAAAPDRVALDVGVERVAVLRARGGGLIFRP